MKKTGLIIIILISIIFTGTVGPVGEGPEQANDQLIRLHVLANSDSENDQALKYKVKDAIIKKIGYKFAAANNINETRQLLLDNLDEVEQVAKETLVALDSEYDVTAQYGRFFFPTKYYGSFSLPAGEYEAVRVIIGQGKGANWWCVLFPPLCFVETKKDTQQANQLKNGYPINTPEQFKKREIRVSFKLLEWIKESFPIIAKIFK